MRGERLSFGYDPIEGRRSSVSSAISVQSMPSYSGTNYGAQPKSGILTSKFTVAEQLGSQALWWVATMRPLGWCCS
jgi:hypothetical protein